MEDKEFTELITFEEEKLKLFYIKVKPGEYSMDFKIIEECNPDDTELITGHLKWDGCMNWKSHETFMYHFCDISDAENLLALFKAVYKSGHEYVAHWNGDGDIDEE